VKELLGIRKGAESQGNLPAFVVFLVTKKLKNYCLVGLVVISKDPR